MQLFFDVFQISDCKIVVFGTEAEEQEDSKRVGGRGGSGRNKVKILCKQSCDQNSNLDRHIVG